MNSALRIGVIGCGLRAQVYCDGADRVPAVQLRAYADVNQAAADRFLAKYGGGYATNDPERVLADPEIDAVFICTWHDTHTALAVSAAAHGKHILIEKPMALTIGECWTIEEAVGKAGVTLTVGLKMRFMPMVRRAKQIAGQPLMMLAQMMNDRTPTRPGRCSLGWAAGACSGRGAIWPTCCAIWPDPIRSRCMAWVGRSRTRIPRSLIARSQRSSSPMAQSPA